MVIVEHKIPTLLTGRALKVTVVLAADEVATYPVPAERPRCTIRVRAGDRTVVADLASKSLRKAQAAIRGTGPDGCVVILQGRLAANDEIVEAGLSAQPKVAKPSVETPKK